MWAVSDESHQKVPSIKYTRGGWEGGIRKGFFEISRVQQ